MSAAEKTVEVVETVAEAAEETIEALDMIGNLNGTTRKQQIIVLVAVGAAGVAVGAGISWLVANRRLKTKYEVLMQEELEATKEFYSNRTYVGVEDLDHEVDPEDLLAEVSEAVAADNKAVKTDYAAVSRNEFIDDLVGPQVVSEERLAAIAAVDEVEAVSKTVFEEDAEAEWLERNERNRMSNRPYVISRDDYFENEEDWAQFTFTWFEEDGVLADEKEDIVPDPDVVVGNWNLERFGWMSGSGTTLYVRAPGHELEIEVVKSDGSYAAEVHGFQHSADTFERRSRGGRVRFGED